MDLAQWIESNRSMFTELSNEIWGYAELGYKEFESSRALEDAFEEAGFHLERGVAEIPTAFVASYGNATSPVIGILGEFDALPGLSQDCVPYQKPLASGAPGHGCGHNLLGVAVWQPSWRSNRQLIRARCKARSNIMAAQLKRAVRARPLWRMRVCSTIPMYV